MKLKKLKLNNVLLEKKSMTQLVGGSGGSTGTYKCGAACYIWESGHTTQAAEIQQSYDMHYWP